MEGAMMINITPLILSAMLGLVIPLPPGLKDGPEYEYLCKKATDAGKYCFNACERAYARILPKRSHTLSFPPLILRVQVRRGYSLQETWRSIFRSLWP